ncbi:WXG100 family type VII secretion target [Streptomyces sp. LP05-1]|uniref:WXG100 family type VII secretion target n=1 Tax=Streptomyces pyxinae TaxID=2970734 RepID=A0ABT2CGE2_9ACTN|nr:WXG100 family type VII secretion target [Streptomyces sp. LP05-1]MCS0636494.1 WXG100 family type VII secretion target [Streptomyces sp. LP05-1]
MAGQQKVGDSSLKGFQDELDQQFTNVKAQLSQLQGVIDGLEGNWRGIGAGAYNKKQNEINNHMVDIGKLLAKFQEAIGKTRTTAANTDDDVQQTVHSVKVDVGAGRPHSNISNL